MLGLIEAAAHDRQGATAIEYGLMAGLISIAIIVALNGIGAGLTDVFTTLMAWL